MFRAQRFSKRLNAIRSLKLSGKSRGFSMIEILVVMFLIAFMIAFLTVAFVRNIQSAKIKAAHTLIRKLDIALHEYYSAFNVYPPDSGYGLDPSAGTQGGTTQYDAGTLYRYLGKQVHWYKPSQSGGTTDMGVFGPFVDHFSDKELKAYNDPIWGQSYIVVDPWFSPIGYIGSPARVIHNRDGVDIFSAGPDRKTASDDTGFNHGWPTNCQHSNTSYSGDPSTANAVGLGYAVLNGCLTENKKSKVIGNSDSSKNEVLDDVNNWDPEH